MSQPNRKLSRRTFFAGAATAGAVAVTATLLPRAVPESESAPEPKRAPDKGGGYRLTEHVQRYYNSTRT